MSPGKNFLPARSAWCSRSSVGVASLCLQLEALGLEASDDIAIRPRWTPSSHHDGTLHSGESTHIPAEVGRGARKRKITALVGHVPREDRRCEVFPTGSNG